MKKFKQGFTLVELSIVLVIIGLLIGGILVAQSLIDSTKIHKLLSRIEQYQIATDLFKERYNYLPGDMPNLNLGSGKDGNGDGDILDHTGSYNEDWLFFEHLSKTEMINEEYAADTNPNNFPRDIIEQGDVIALSQDTLIYSPASQITAQALDSKGDDGNALTGNIFAGDIDDNCCYSPSGRYNISADSKSCDLNFSFNSLPAKSTPSCGGND